MFVKLVLQVPIRMTMVIVMCVLWGRLLWVQATQNV